MYLKNIDFGAILRPSWLILEALGGSWRLLRPILAVWRPTSTNLEPLGSVLGTTRPDVGKHEASMKPAQGNMIPT